MRLLALKIFFQIPLSLSHLPRANNYIEKSSSGDEPNRRFSFEVEKL
jgi:hypothetical protein